MDAEQQWELNIVRDRHRWLKLTPKQVRAVWEMEKEDREMLGLGLDMDHLTIWEEMDRDIDRWRAILKAEQFNLWMEHQKRQLRRHGQEAKEHDKRDLKEVEFHLAYIEWLRKAFLPQLHKDVGVEGIMMGLYYKDKIDYLRAEFRKHRLRRKSDVIVKHYRYYRRTQPNTLRLSLLQNELSALLPDYVSFVRTADDGVKAVAAVVLDKLKPHFKHHGELLLQKIAPVAEHRKALREKFFGDETPKGGWQFVIERQISLTPAEEAWMSYLRMETAPRSVCDTLDGAAK